MKYIIEISGPKNEQQYFTPANTLVRGRWHVANVSTREQSVAMRALNRVTEIPGQRIELDVNQRTGKITDPLRDDPDGKEKFKVLNEIFDEHQEAHGGPKDLPAEKVYKNLSVDEIKTWLHHMRQILDNKMAMSIGNRNLPKIETIASMPGKREKDPGNTGSKDKELANDRFVDEVPVESQ